MKQLQDHLLINNAPERKHFTDSRSTWHIHKQGISEE